MLEAIKSGKVAEWIRKKIDTIFGSGNRVHDEVIEDIEELFRKINDGFGFDGGRLLTIKEIKKLRKLLKELYDVDLKIVDKDFGMKQKLKDWNARGVVGSFNPRLKTMFLRSEVSELTVFHEMVHMKTWKRLSPEEYAKLPLWEDETIVWDAICKTKDKWTKRELVDSYEYVNDRIRIPMGQPKLIIDEMEELVKLKKLGMLK